MKLMLAALLAASPAAATNSPIELKGVVASLMAWLPGEYDSEPQRFFEAEYITPPDQQHQRIYRAFTRIEAPDVGENVIVATVHASVKYSAFDFAEFQVWTVSVDVARQAVVMSPRKFKDPEAFRGIATYAAKLKGLKAYQLAPASGAAGCDIVWRLIGTQLRGHTEPGRCTSTLRRANGEATFDWEWLLNDEELWITFAGKDGAGNLVMGRADQTHWRLMKARTFECFLAYRPDGGPEQVHNGFAMHDRGDVHRLDLKDARGTTPVFLELIRGVWPSNSGRNYLDLLRFTVYEGDPAKPREELKIIGNSLGSAGTDRAGFAAGPLSARCKLPKPPT